MFVLKLIKKLDKATSITDIVEVRRPHVNRMPDVVRISDDLLDSAVCVSHASKDYTSALILSSEGSIIESIGLPPRAITREDEYTGSRLQGDFHPHILLSPNHSLMKHEAAGMDNDSIKNYVERTYDAMSTYTITFADINENELGYLITNRDVAPPPGSLIGDLVFTLQVTPGQVFYSPKSKHHGNADEQALRKLTFPIIEVGSVSPLLSGKGYRWYMGMWLISPATANLFRVWDGGVKTKVIVTDMQRAIDTYYRGLEEARTRTINELTKN